MTVPKYNLSMVISEVIMMTPKMGRPPSENPKVKKLTIRISEKDMKELEETSILLGVSKTDVVLEGIHLLNRSIKK